MRVLSALACLLALTILLPSTGVAAAPERRQATSAPGRRVNPHQLPTQPPTGDTPEQVTQLPRQVPVDQATYARLKSQADAAATARDKGNGQGSLETEPAAQFATLGSTQTGGWNPPDGGLAVGPTSVLTMANEAVAIYDRSGALKLGPLALPAFFNDSSASSVYDPRALYDAGNAASNGYNGGHGRFIVLATDGTNFALAVSQNESPQSPTTAWCSYLINGVTGSDWVDYPALGMDGDNLYLTSNQFLNGSNAFEFARLMVVPKASVYPDATSGACPTFSGTDFTNLQNPGGGTSFTVQPATQPDALPGSGATMYLVNSIWSSGSNIVVRSVTPGPNGPLLSNPNWVTSGFVASYNLPASVPQPNSSARVDSGDSRLLGAVYRYGSIYTANTTGTTSLSSTPNPYANAQWYQITPTGPGSSVGSSNVVANSSIAYFFPGVIPVCASGPSCTSPKVVLEASVSGRSQPASAAVVANGKPTVFQRGVSGYRLNSRWGDYPAVAADPTAPGTAWFLGEYARTTTSWSTATSNLTP